MSILDVAACAERLIEGRTAFGGLSNSQRRTLVVLIALHDAGKLSAAGAHTSGQWHSDKDLLRSDKRIPCFGRLPEAGG